MPAMDDDAVCQINRSACIAGKRRSRRKMLSPVGARLARDKSDAVYQRDRVTAFAGKPRSNGQRFPVGVSLLAMNDDAVCQINRSACIAGKRAPTEKHRAAP